MTKRIITLIFAVTVCFTAYSDTKEAAKLNAWVMPNGMDDDPCDANAPRYTVYMTEFPGEDVSQLQDSILRYGTEAMHCTRICDMFLYYWQNEQYCTYLIEYEADADTSVVIDGKYHITNNSVAVFVYDDGANFDVSIVGDIYNTVSVYGCYFVDDTQPGAKYAPWIHQATGTENVTGYEADTTRKVMIDGVIYIEKNGNLYDFGGKIVKSVGK